MRLYLDDDSIFPVLVQLLRHARLPSPAEQTKWPIAILLLLMLLLLLYFTFRHK